MIDEKTAPDIVVDRGQPVIVTVYFPFDPDEVNFYYTKPGSDRPHTDDGFGQIDSKIERLGPGVYRYVINTNGFAAGEGEWKFASEWREPLPEGCTMSAIRGEYRINRSKLP